MLLNDFTYAARTLRHSPLFALTGIVTIGLGIGATTAIFTVTNAVLLRPLPYSNPDGLILICSDMKKRNVRDFPFSNADYFDLRKQASRNFEDIAAVNTGRNVVPMQDGTPEQIRTARVTPNFFSVMGAKVLFGRDFTDADAQPQPPQPAAGSAAGPAPARLPTIAILSYEYWQRRYGGSTSILGWGTLDGGKSGPQVVGVLAPGFELFFAPSFNIERRPDMWIAGRLAYDNANRNNVSLRLVGRLKQNTSLQQAQSEVDLVANELRKNFPIKETAGLHIRLEPMHKYLVEPVQPAILTMMGAVIFVLLIACANVVNLLLVRTSLREREYAVRTALGGSWWRIVRQMLAEGLIIAACGTLLGVGLAWGGIRVLLALAPANLPRLDNIQIDAAVVGFAAIAGLAAAVVIGFAPSLRGLRPDVMHVLRSSGRTAALSGGRVLRDGVVITEVALSFVLLVGSGLMLRSFQQLQRIDPGFDPKNLLTFQDLGNRGGNTPEKRAAFMREFQARLAALPGIRSVTGASLMPLTEGFSPIRWGLEPALVDPSKFQAADVQIVQPGYFETLRTPLLAGQTFSGQENTPERKAVIIDQLLAAKAFPNASAVGKRILVRLGGPEPEWVEVIGVVAHQRFSSLAETGREQVFFPDGYLGFGSTNRWAVRTDGDPANYASAIRAEMRKQYPNLMITEMQSMEELVSRAQAGTRFTLQLIGLFALIAALLAAIGLYGVLSTVVRQRTAEIGLRMALGAPPTGIFQLIVGRGMRLAGAGIVLGFVAALGLTRLLSSMLVGVTPTDPPIFAAIVVLFLLIAAMASWMPAMRASRLAPTEALREE